MDRTRTMPNDAICGLPVLAPGGERLGEIDELVVDLRRGRIDWAVVAAGTRPGGGDRVLALPWSRLESDGRSFRLRDGAPLGGVFTFDRGRWPDFRDHRWSAPEDGPPATPAGGRRGPHGRHLP